MTDENEATRNLKKFMMRIQDSRARGRLDPIYERHGVDPSEGVSALVSEIRLDGANTIASIFRGWEGVEYDEIVRDVAEHISVKVKPSLPLFSVERKIVENLLGRSLSELNKSNSKEVKTKKANIEKVLKGLTDPGVPTDLQALVAQLGSGLIGAAALAAISSEILPILLPRVAARFAVGGIAGLGAFAVPLLNVALAGAAISAVAGPAFRKTAPTVVDVALMRLEFGLDGEGADVR